MNIKRILSIFIIFTVLMLCCGAAFASDTIDDSNHDGYSIDDFNLGDPDLDGPDLDDEDFEDDDDSDLDDEDFEDDDDSDLDDEDFDDDDSDLDDEDFEDDDSDLDDEDFEDDDSDLDDEDYDDDEADLYVNTPPQVVKDAILVWYDAVSSGMSMKYTSQNRAGAASDDSSSDREPANAPDQLDEDSNLAEDTATSPTVTAKDSSHDVVDEVIKGFSGENVVKTAKNISGGAKHASAKTLPATGNPLALLGLALCSIVIYYRKR
ncbi:hypothetical protein [Methanobrevibacter sp.]|uniref:hypothetical protein n=1 Tax=Methanobrevibacter sp. TaxID=66852 RepID=UPI00388FFC5C